MELLSLLLLLLLLLHLLFFLNLFLFLNRKSAWHALLLAVAGAKARGG
jgi:hypothetical protein